MAKKTLSKPARAKEPRATAKKATPPRVAKATRTARPARGELLTLLDFVRYAVSRFIEADVAFAHGTTDPVADAAFLVCEALHLHPDQLEMFATARVTATESAKLLDLIEARVTTRKPTAYLVNKIYMRGLPFYVDERVIVPRSFIGELLDSHFSGSDEMDGGALIDDLGAVESVLDLCTGSGCLAILASRHFPNARIDAVDLSKDALKVAAKNVADYGLTDRIALHNGDLFAPLGDARYDLIISNPPYVDAQGMVDLPRECRFEPKMAFDGGDDGLDIVHRILHEAAWHLTPHGGLLCEIGRCRDALEAAYPELPMLWLDTEDSEGEVFWIDAATLATLV
jgi:ribosomal protein L3 glutamine methyltransferase